MARELRVLADADAVARAVADEILAVLPRSGAADRVPGRDVAIALAGGRTPLAAYEIVAAEGGGADWSRVTLWWGDERCVPPDHAASNYRAARTRLVDRVRIPAANVHRIRGEMPPADAAAAYERALRARWTGASPEFDLVLLGIGDDGHTASLFPGGAECDERERWVVPSVGPFLPLERVTLTLPALSGARRVVFAVTGESKRPALTRVLAGDTSLPAARVHAAGATVVIADRAASPPGTEQTS